MNIETIWNNILLHEGEVFYTSRGLEFTYVVIDDHTIKPFRDGETRWKLNKHVFEKALEFDGDYSSTRFNNTIIGSSYVRALLLDPRISNNETHFERPVRTTRQPRKKEVEETTPLGEPISAKINRFYDLIRNYQEGGPNTRYKSWEWCHKAFLDNRLIYRNADDDLKNEIVELLSLHLAFYLASWGMYRGSSYLLQRDYKAHKNAVRYMLDNRYDLLWNYIPTEENIDEAARLIFDSNDGIYFKVKNSYSNYEGNDDDASDTLTTKILMGSFGCVPAFDRFLKKGIGKYTKHYRNTGLTQSIENNNGKTFKALARFALTNEEELRFECDFPYPVMKRVDMYFWQTGYELDIADSLMNGKLSDDKKAKLYQEAIELGLCNDGLTYLEASNMIKEKN